ncbi:MAG: V-type ATP synthase subunit F [Johnsonella sp.]|nr:V-type ATP synthase subunit F [Johnsonella sp.]
MKLYLISDNIDTLTGIRLAGIEGCIVHTKAELCTALGNALSDPEIGIILLTEKFSRDFPDEVNKIKLEQKHMLFIDIPDRHGTGRSPDFITDYVNRAIGLKL